MSGGAFGEIPVHPWPGTPIGTVDSGLIRVVLPQDGEVAELLALMLLTEGLRSARISSSGELVTLEEQDRGA